VRRSAEAAPPARAARQSAVDLTLRASRADAGQAASAHPEIPRAQLMPAPAYQPPAAPDPVAPAAAAPVSIQALAERVCRVLERRLIVERERRGIR